jgi:GT2 family glycosyltransferase/glycosyltransferase involved in cell wall biosynthesis/protein-L-isoaspartate O-methyltransferase
MQESIPERRVAQPVPISEPGAPEPSDAQTLARQQAIERWEFGDRKKLLYALIGYDFGSDPESRLDEIRASKLHEAQFLIQALAPQPSDRILDLGSGCGFIARAFAPLCERLFCVDISSEFLAFCKDELRNFPNVEFQQMEFAKLDFLAGARINKAYSNAVFIHFNLFDIVLYLRQLLAILEPGGRFVFSMSDTDCLDIVSDRYFAPMLEEYARHRQPATLMNWNSSSAVCLAAVKIGFTAKILWRGKGSAMVLLEKPPQVATKCFPAALGQPRSETPTESSSHNLLLIHEVLPHHDRSGSDLRLMSVIREIRRQGHRLTYLARHAANYEKYAPQLEALGVRVVADDPDRMRAIGEDRTTTWNFQALLQQERFTAAILFHWFWSGASVVEDYLDDIRRHSPQTHILLLTDDRHGERERRLSQCTGALADRERGNGFEAREIEAYRRADLVLYISDADKKHFLTLCPDLSTELLPMQVDLAEPGPPFAERSGILFLGNFENLANRDALAWFLDSIWPLVLQQDPALQLLVVGNASPTDLQEKHRNVECMGRVDDLAPLFARARVFAAPIRYGTGINTKNLQAMAHGLPVVTTTIGAEGMQLQNGVDGLIADTPQSFANALLRLHRDADLWEKLAAAGRQTVASNFSSALLDAQLQKILARAREIPAQPYTAPVEWSYREIERSNLETLTQRPPRYRPLLRVVAFWQAGQRHLAAGRLHEALAQFRNVFTLHRGDMPATLLHVRLLQDMALVYRRLNDEAAAIRCEKSASTLLPPFPASPQRSKNAKSSAKQTAAAAPTISVIIPTCNRKGILRLCLAALAAQNLPADRWEIVVVDDGSTDGTDAFLESYIHPNKNLRVLHQENSGAGAARHAGVQAARGEYVLLLNDDTIAGPQLLSEHLRAHRESKNEKVAILGAFRPSEESTRRPLSCWINHSPFLFPQNNLQPGGYREAAFFITCNLSLRRDAILEAGNFDPEFRVAEDTELGARLMPRGYSVWFHPAALAWHEHPQFDVNDLVRRARIYGDADWKLFAKHPQLLGTGAGPFGLLRDSDIALLRSNIENNREAVAIGFSALQKLDQLATAPLFQKRPDGSMPAEQLWAQLSKVVPLVYWQYLFESFLAARSAALAQLSSAAAASPQLATTG